MAAQLGLKACYWQPPVKRIRERCKVYAQVRSELEGRTYQFGEDQAVMRGTYVASSMEEARRDAEAGMMSVFAHNQSMRGMQIFLNPGEEVGADTKLDWDFLESRSLLVGSPALLVTRTTVSSRKRPCATLNVLPPTSCRTSLTNFRSFTRLEKSSVESSRANSEAAPNSAGAWIAGDCFRLQACTRRKVFHHF